MSGPPRWVGYEGLDKRREGVVGGDPVEALAEAWASIDGKVDLFRAEKGLSLKAPFNTGTHEGYIEEAKELIRRLHTRGWRLTGIA